MSRQVWKGSTLLNPEPPVLVSCGAPEKPNLITVGWTGTICTQPPMLSISVRPERYSHKLIKESGGGGGGSSGGSSGGTVVTTHEASQYKGYVTSKEIGATYTGW